MMEHPLTPAFPDPDPEPEPVTTPWADHDDAGDTDEDTSIDGSMIPDADLPDDVKNGDIGEYEGNLEEQGGDPLHDDPAFEG